MEEIKVSYLNRKLINFICANCGKEGSKPLSEYNRNVKLGRVNCCCRSCASSYNNKHRTHKPASEAQLQHLRDIAGSTRDEFSPFRYTLRNIRKRSKEVNIDLEYLKYVWEQQQGICPYTGIKLILPETNNLQIVHVTERASLDRIDSSKGYIKGNVQFVSTPINYMKNEMSDMETKSFLHKISSYTSTFVEDETISSPQEEVEGAQAGN